MKKYLIERGNDKTIMTEHNLLWFTQSQTKTEACIKLDQFDDTYKITPITNHAITKTVMTTPPI